MQVTVIRAGDVDGRRVHPGDVVDVAPVVAASLNWRGIIRLAPPVADANLPPRVLRRPPRRRREA